MSEWYNNLLRVMKVGCVHKKNLVIKNHEELTSVVLIFIAFPNAFVVAIVVQSYLG